MKESLIFFVISPHRHNPEEPDRNGKNPEEIGIFTIYLILVSLSVLFLGGMIAYLWMRYSLEQGHKSTWAFRKIEEVHLFFIPTSLTLAFSLKFLNSTIQFVKKNIFLKVSQFLKSLWVMGVFFILQEVLFLVYFRQLFINFDKNIFLFIFFLLTFLHNFHFVLGMFFLSLFILKSNKQKYNSNSHSDLKYLKIYWNYLVFVWFFIYFFMAVF